MADVIVKPPAVVPNILPCQVVNVTIPPLVPGPFAYMLRGIFFALLTCVAIVPRTSAQASDDALPIYYAVERGAMIYSAPDSMRPYMPLPFREPVFLLDEDEPWLRVKTQDGKHGYVPARSVSNIWIRVSKASKTLYVYRGTELLHKVAADFGVNAFSDKEKRGSAHEPDHWRTPEGVFYVIAKNPRSTFYKALVLNYPNAEDAERGRRRNIISSKEYAAIVDAERDFRVPPMNTALGGFIEIHGHGTGAGVNWTQGCVAIHDHHIDELWQLAKVGTPVLIE